MKYFILYTRRFYHELHLALGKKTLTPTPYDSIVIRMTNGAENLG